MSPSERRERLVEWMRGVTSEEIMAGTRILYGDLVWASSIMPAIGRDLRQLVAEGKVRRLPGRPARWEVVR